MTLYAPEDWTSEDGKSSVKKGELLCLDTVSYTHLADNPV